MSTTIVNRGASVLFRATFLDENGDPMTPTKVRLRASAGKKVHEVAMTADGEGGFFSRLDTRLFHGMHVDWQIRASGGSDTSVSELGTLLLESNKASGS